MSRDYYNEIRRKSFKSTNVLTVRHGRVLPIVLAVEMYPFLDLNYQRKVSNVKRKVSSSSSKSIVTLMDCVMVDFLRFVIIYNFCIMFTKLDSDGE